MAHLKFGSAGISSREIDISGPVTQEPVGIPAGVIGTTVKGPAFVPVTVGAIGDYTAKFGKSDGKKFGPLASNEWLRKAGALTYIRVLGVGDGLQRVLDGTTAGSVTNAGFIVGSKLPRESDGMLAGNDYANSGTLGSPLGRVYFLGAAMSESAGSTVFSSAGLQGLGSITPGVKTAVPIIRGIIMAPSGVIVRLSASNGNPSGSITSTAPASTLVATNTNAQGLLVGAVVLTDGTTAKQDFVMLLNGHKGTNPLYPNVVTASFDMTAPNYFANVLNTDPYKIQEAGHYLYAHWDVHPCTAVITGSGLVVPASGAGSPTAPCPGAEDTAFLTTGSLARGVGSATIPDYEAFTDRFSYSKSPWVISQKFGGSASNLFRLHALDAGADISTQYKVSIENIVPSLDPSNQYGSFDLIIRDWNDRDGSIQPLEQHRGLVLDPSSDRYIAKVIGDANVFFDFDRAEPAQKLVIDGNYESRSNLIRVEVDSGVDNGITDPTALPMGFRGIDHLITSGSAPLTSISGSSLSSNVYLKRAVTPPLPMRMNITMGSGAKMSVNPLLYWGVQFEHVTALATPNASTYKNDSLKAFTKYFPDFSTINENVLVGDNVGDPDTAALGIVDADRFCRNMFTLENIQVVTASTTYADPAQWANAAYVRDGNIVANHTLKTRRFGVDDLNQTNRRFAKFTFMLQGGFNGTNMFDRDSVAINNTAVTADMNDALRFRAMGPNVRSYAKALEIMKNVVNVDIQLLAIPGIRHPIITDAAADAVRERFDALYIMDIEQYDNDANEITDDDQLSSVSVTARAFADRAVDNSFCAAYFPDQVMPDPVTKTNVVVPPSVAVLGAFALNDSVGHPWFAPAGFTRGALATVIEAHVQLSKPNMDVLYDVGINPIVAFPGGAVGGTDPKGGVIVWGQKTLQVAASALDRVNVRRLLIEIRRQVRDIARTIIFEPSRAATLASFTSKITPRLQRIQAQSGLQRFKIIIDSSTTTQADIENNTLRGKIYVQPTRVYEFVSLDFVVTNAASPE